MQSTNRRPVTLPSFKSKRSLDGPRLGGRSPTIRRSTLSSLNRRPPVIAVSRAGDAGYMAGGRSFPAPYGTYTRALQGLCVRRSELARTRWSWFNDDLTLLTIPGVEMKTGRPHLVPVPHLLRDLLRTLPSLPGRISSSAPTGEIDWRLQPSQAEDRRGAHRRWREARAVAPA